MIGNIFRKRIRPGRSALWLIAVLLLTSGGIRLATGTGPALAREIENLGVEDPAHEMGNAAECEAPKDIAKVLDALGMREVALEKREAALADRMAALSLVELEVERNLTALESAEQALAQTLSVADKAAEGDLDRLTAVYENMKPKEAAKVFEEMAPEFAAGFLGRMRPDAAASIMSGIGASTAYSISVILAGRNANVPTE